MVCAAIFWSHWRCGVVQALRGEHLLQCVVDALLVGHQGVADGGLADVADDAGGDVLVGHLAPGGGQVGFAEAGLVEFQRQLAQLLAGQFARPGEHGHQRRDVVAVAVG